VAESLGVVILGTTGNLLWSLHRRWSQTWRRLWF